MLDVATVLTTIFAYVDDYCKQHSSVRRGPLPKLSDSEVITLTLVGELLGKSSEYAQTRCAKQWLEDYFPHMIDRSRYHRRLGSLSRLINDVRITVLPLIVDSLSLQIVDSTPIPVLSFRRAGYTPLFPEAAYGHCAAKRLTYYGFKLHLVTTIEGIPLHFDLTPANVADVSIMEELLVRTASNATVLADKGYISHELALSLAERNGIDVWTTKRQNQKGRESKQERKHLNALRQKIEIINGILKTSFQFERTLAKTLTGLVNRIIRKFTAFTFGILINKLHGRDLLHIASIIN